jgi:hypothetical protein
MGAKLIAFECTASAHQPTLIYPDKLTIHDGAWAFCPFDARATGHLWRSTGGADLETLLRHVGLSVSADGLVQATR